MIRPDYAAIRPYLFLALLVILAFSNSLRNSFVKTGRTDEAVRSYRLALSLDKEYAEAHNNLGIALRKKGLLKESVAEFETAVRIKPDLDVAQRNLEEVKTLLDSE